MFYQPCPRFSRAAAAFFLVICCAPTPPHRARLSARSVHIQTAPSWGSLGHSSASTSTVRPRSEASFAARRYVGGPVGVSERGTEPLATSEPKQSLPFASCGCPGKVVQDSEKTFVFATRFFVLPGSVACTTFPRSTNESTTIGSCCEPSQSACNVFFCSVSSAAHAGRSICNIRSTQCGGVGQQRTVKLAVILCSPPNPLSGTSEKPKQLGVGTTRMFSVRPFASGALLQHCQQVLIPAP
jgi:hypothetical protein